MKTGKQERDKRDGKACSAVQEMQARPLFEPHALQGLLELSALVRGHEDVAPPEELPPDVDLGEGRPLGILLHRCADLRELFLVKIQLVE